MPNKQNRRSSRSSKKRNNPNDLMTVQSSRSTAAAQVAFPKEDLNRRFRAWILNQSPPRALSNQIFWIQGKRQSTQVISTTAPVEFNLAFYLSDTPDISPLSGFFDQYCIFSVVVNLPFNYSGTTPGGLGSVFTAIDFDNVGNIGGPDAIESYESCLSSKISADQSIQRLIHPCVAQSLYTTTGGAFAGYSVSRSWIDSANSSVPHYGFRSFYISNVGTTLTALYDVNYVFGFRNNL
jgi:hypothetical protein